MLKGLSETKYCCRGLLLAYFDHSENLWEQSNIKIQDLIKTYPNQKYFCSKALLLMAKNFEALR